MIYNFSAFIFPYICGIEDFTSNIHTHVQRDTCMCTHTLQVAWLWLESVVTLDSPPSCVSHELEDKYRGNIFDP